MQRRITVLLMIASSSLALVFGQASSPSFAPSRLAREVALGEVAALSGESEEAHARRIFAAALDVERALRFGYTCQDARARLRQRIRLEAGSGEENGARMSKKLEKEERKNAKIVKRPANVGIGNGGGKGKIGQ